ncbi:hypothetical protein SASPL_113759 [Salvia splendens]|uniref:Uncharacterized protein n=1 Tax=Salvia splendens TaxID=180675 RepID=A0A8X8Y498_SALSN|nr:hypothetical protein SASPL_113759 [Salvia splendens]
MLISSRIGLWLSCPKTRCIRSLNQRMVMTFLPARLSSREMHSYDVKMTSTPVDRVRELIKKYGQSGASAVTKSRGLSVKLWEDDNGDNIPEWRPEAPTRLPTHPMGSNLVYQPSGGLAQAARWPRPCQHMHDARRRQQ